MLKLEKVGIWRHWCGVRLTAIPGIDVHALQLPEPGIWTSFSGAELTARQRVKNRSRFEINVCVPTKHSRPIYSPCRFSVPKTFFSSTSYESSGSQKETLYTKSICITPPFKTTSCGLIRTSFLCFSLAPPLTSYLVLQRRGM